MEGWNFAFIRRADYFHTLEINVSATTGNLLLRILENGGTSRSWKQVDEDDRVRTWEDVVNLAMVDSLMSG